MRSSYLHLICPSLQYSKTGRLIYVFPFLFLISSYNMFHLYLFKLIVNFYMVADILTAAQEVYQVNYVSVHQPLLSLLSAI